MTIPMMALPLMLLVGGCAAKKTPSEGMGREGATDAAVIRSVAANDESTRFAVVELFTSEGCSSCPPADRLLGEIAEKGRNDGERIFTLSFHVDYWNRLGWIDPFSAEAYTDRQGAYARALGLASIYTPQMIVNGRREFVGSNAATAREAIASALAEPATAWVTLGMTTRRGSGDVVVEYQVSGETGGRVLNIALVESELSVKVPRGENAGRTLHHDDVVRAFTTVALDGTGAGNIDIPVGAGLRRESLSVIAYVQDPATMAITGATQSAAPPI